MHCEVLQMYRNITEIFNVEKIVWTELVVEMWIFHSSKDSISFVVFSVCLKVENQFQSGNLKKFLHNMNCAC